MGHAKERDRIINITNNQIWNVFLKQRGYCRYTGEKLTDANMSLDRIDSKKGYIKNNIQWVTKGINFMKRNFPEKEWLYFCKKVSEHKI